MATTNEPSTRWRFGQLLPLWLLCYAAMIVAVVWSMTYARSWAMSNLATPRSLEQWQTWREEAGERNDRRMPKSDEPPGLVLMRDYFAVCLVGAILFTTLLYWIIAWFVTGMLERQVRR